MTDRIGTLQAMRGQRHKALQEACELRASQGKTGSLRSLISGIVQELRALDDAITCLALEPEIKTLVSALTFYADPETYVAIGFLPDHPCGAFWDDFGETRLGVKPGQLARETLDNLTAATRGR